MPQTCITTGLESSLLLQHFQPKIKICKNTNGDNGEDRKIFSCPVKKKFLATNSNHLPVGKCDYSYQSFSWQHFRFRSLYCHKPAFFLYTWSFDFTEQLLMEDIYHSKSVLWIWSHDFLVDHYKAGGRHPGPASSCTRVVTRWPDKFLVAGGTRYLSVSPHISADQDMSTQAPSRRG